MKKIPLTQGRVALVDDKDYNWLNQWKWHIIGDAKRSKNGYSYYAAHWESRTGKHKRKTWLMHRVILGLARDDKRQCDHRDGNGLNNQQSNLRVCTARQNQQSSRKKKLGTSEYKGVCWHRRTRKWYARIYPNGEAKSLGLFHSEEAAAQAYNEAALRYYGEFARLNEI